ncbi:MAG: cyclohexa-1,5-dienecarbonyl-CoA hydratase [Planctomycetes bacterium]|nr:cyclohexa-1,5-dienecarbonyl-CoA hydratase [Planctomycetota bacterium]MDP6408687.1 enoyl-CoA hydratase/isomerase family protein [Planctomycetota bacterium]
METSTWETIRVEHLSEGKFARLSLAGGRGNVIDSEMTRELRDAAATLGPNRSLRAILLDHVGDDFCFGASVVEHRPAEVAPMLAGLHALARELWALEIPILVSVRGRCLGGGLELAALGDRIFAAPGASFAQPEVVLGVFAPLGSLLLEPLVGAAHAADLLLSGRAIDATEAHAMGLASEVTDDPRQAALDWAETHLAPHSASSLRHATGALRRARRRHLEEGLADLEERYLSELMETHDAVEGIEAFLAKRPARWEDR